MSDQEDALPVRDREADRRRFPDVAFNRWLDEGISDAGHTVWDQVRDVCDAWHGWMNRPFYDPAASRRYARAAEDNSGQMLYDALRKLLTQTNNIEVLGEWEVQEINRSESKRLRAQVNAVIALSRAALAAWEEKGKR